MEYSNSSILMDAKELEKHLGITRNSAYSLLHNETFPTVKVGGRLYAVRDEVDVWIIQQAIKGGYTYGKKAWER